MAETIMELLVVAAEAGSPSVPQTSEPPGPPVHVTPLCIADPAGEGVDAKEADLISAQTILESPILHPRALMAMSVSWTHHLQIDLDAMRISDSLLPGIVDGYNTDRRVEFRVGHLLRNREAVHMVVKNYNILRNVEYRVVESNKISISA
ncbi:hypothetical protein PIB30_067376 [Stylosanthes scabra]|uniref:Uncharacterized protein n=1 Tax=Stylosanthes scabra TaxID=79078 RepID=A0ABU6VQW0_9FABA|nr:hypothetical protein [Stylosanthes scabra]